MAVTYVLASSNPGKLRELRMMLEPLALTVKPQGDWGVPEAVEDASTFIENALIKARQAARMTGLPAIADDSGLVVPSLGGQPGIHSARYAGEDADSRANMNRLLAELQGKVGTERNAHFYCVLVLVDSADDPAPLVATGRWHGRILEEPRGTGGFGYDPLFGVNGMPGVDGVCSAAELEPGQKAAVSHRGQALREMVRQLRARDENFTG